MVILDTHIWLWWLLGDGSLTNSERAAIDHLAELQQICISWVTVWETEMLERKNRISLEPNLTAWIRESTNPVFMQVLPVDIDVVLAQRLLPDSFHGDPADRLITATSILSEFELFTHDNRIIESDCCNIWAPDK